MKIEEGYIDFLEYQTYYRIIGEKIPGKAPLLFLHGGPGSSHNYFELFDELALEGQQLIMYDQLGCGKSSVPDKPDLWTLSTWLEELKNLIAHLKLEELHILGQSWGGMLLIAYLIDEKPKGIQSAILSSTLPSASLWEKEQHRLIRLMSEEERELLLKPVPKDEEQSKAYEQAVAHYMELHSAGPFDENSPEPLLRKRVSGAQSYLYGWGPNEFSPTGTLKSFEYVARLKKIEIPVLITSGTDDLSTPLINKVMLDNIPDAQWELFADSRHMPFVDEHQKYLTILKNWLEKKKTTC